MDEPAVDGPERGVETEKSRDGDFIFWWNAVERSQAGNTPAKCKDDPASESPGFLSGLFRVPQSPFDQQSSSRLSDSHDSSSDNDDDTSLSSSDTSGSKDVQRSSVDSAGKTTAAREAQRNLMDSFSSSGLENAVMSETENDSELEADISCDNTPSSLDAKYFSSMEEEVSNVDEESADDSPTPLRTVPQRFESTPRHPRLEARPIDLSAETQRLAPTSKQSRATLASTPGLKGEQKFWRRVEAEAAARRHLVALVIRVRECVGRPDGDGKSASVNLSMKQLMALREELLCAIRNSPEGDDEFNDAVKTAEFALRTAIATAKAKVVPAIAHSSAEALEVAAADDSDAGSNTVPTASHPPTALVDRDQICTDDDDTVAFHRLRHIVQKVHQCLQNNVDSEDILQKLQSELTYAVDACPNGDDELDDAAIDAEEKLELALAHFAETAASAREQGSTPLTPTPTASSIAESNKHRGSTSGDDIISDAAQQSESEQSEPSVISEVQTSDASQSTNDCDGMVSASAMSKQVDPHDPRTLRHEAGTARSPVAAATDVGLAVSNDHDDARVLDVEVSIDSSVNLRAYTPRREQSQPYRFRDRRRMHSPSSSSFPLNSSLPAFPHKPRAARGDHQAEMDETAAIALEVASAIITTSAETSGVNTTSTHCEQASKNLSFRRKGKHRGSFRGTRFDRQRNAAAQRRREEAERKRAAAKERENRVRTLQLAARLNGARRRRQLLKAAQSSSFATSTSSFRNRPRR